MASQVLSGELWNEIGLLFPVCKPSHEGSRRLNDHPAALSDIVFLLKTGIGWKELPTEALG